MARKQLRIIIIGLPLFAKRLEADLKSHNPLLKVDALNTYYSFKDKLLAFLLIPFSDVVYSINGSLSPSKIFNWTLLWNKKLMMTWVGSDVLVAKSEDQPVQEYLRKAHHYCEVSWIQKELETLNIKAEILNFFNFKETQKSDFPDLSKGKLTVLSYLAKGNELEYGLTQLLSLAKSFPEVSFNIVGSDGEGLAQLENLNYLGWVSDMKSEFDKAHITARLINHDGLSGFVLESLLLEKHVLYSQPLDSCIQVSTPESCVDAFGLIYEQYKTGMLEPNRQGRNYVLEHFSRTRILDNLIDEMSK